jgi:hypothetical protein
MFPSRDIKVPKITHIPRRMLEFPGFWNFNISTKEHSVELTFLRISYLKVDMPVGQIAARYVGIYHTRDQNSSEMPITLN